MPRPSLAKIPPETLRIIIGYLIHEPTPSLSALACVSKYFYSAATPFLFYTIKFSMGGEDPSQGVAQQIQKYTRILQRDGGFAHVHRITIDGSPNEDDKLNDEFNLLADLIPKLPGLGDLEYSCPLQFPECLLDALHKTHPQCRLRINTFQLHSLYAPGTDAYDYEYKLTTSPCLHSINIRYDEMCGYDSSDVPSYHGEAVMRMVAGLAPDLKEVRISHVPPGASPGYIRTIVWRPWTGFTQEKEDRSRRVSRGALQYFRWFDYLPIDGPAIKKWQLCTDFSKLRSLDLASSKEVTEDALDFLASQCSFRSLRELFLNLRPVYDERRQSSDYYKTAERFLLSLPPLADLSLLYWHPEINLDTVFAHHRSLRKLWLRPSETENVSHQDLVSISTYCPQLEDLVIPIPRSRGDAAEVMLYRALGSISGLQRLKLQLDASDVTAGAENEEEESDSDENADYPPSANNPSWSEFDQQISDFQIGTYKYLRNGHIRDALFNSALDESLARAIFQAISIGKPPGSLALEELSLCVTGAGALGDRGQSSTWHGVMQCLSRDWVIKRNIRDDSRNQLIVNEVKGEGFDDPEAWADQELRPSLKPLFRSIWPEKYEGSPWAKDWHSFPLANVDC